MKRAEELYLLKFHLEDFDIFVSLKKCADICITYDFLCNNRLCQNVGFSRIHCRTILLDATYTFARERIRFCFFCNENHDASYFSHRMVDYYIYRRVQISGFTRQNVEDPRGPNALNFRRLLA